MTNLLLPSPPQCPWVVRPSTLIWNSHLSSAPSTELHLLARSLTSGRHCCLLLLALTPPLRGSLLARARTSTEASLPPSLQPSETIFSQPTCESCEGLADPLIQQASAL